MPVVEAVGSFSAPLLAALSISLSIGFGLYRWLIVRLVIDRLVLYQSVCALSIGFYRSAWALSMACDRLLVIGDVADRLSI